jgi:prephenate dehydratase
MPPSNSKSEAARAADAERQVEQVLQAQMQVQQILLEGTALAFAQCTSTSTAAQLSRREKGCVQMSMANYVAARAHIGQVLSQRAQDAGKDM